jgi:hypothetical protein
MRRLLVIGATTAAVLAIGGTALAATSGSGRSRPDDGPSHLVVDPSASASPAEDNPSRGVDDNPTPGESVTSIPAIDPTVTPSPGATVDDHGGLRTGGTDDGPGDDHGRGGHGGDDRPGDDHGGSGRR